MTIGPKLNDKPVARNNVALISFVTCLILQELLANLVRRVLYFDTESVIFTIYGSNDSDTKEYLSDLTYEITDEFDVSA